MLVVYLGPQGGDSKQIKLIIDKYKQMARSIIHSDLLMWHCRITYFYFILTRNTYPCYLLILIHIQIKIIQHHLILLLLQGIIFNKKTASIWFMVLLCFNVYILSLWMTCVVNNSECYSSITLITITLNVNYYVCSLALSRRELSLIIIFISWILLHYAIISCFFCWG